MQLKHLINQRNMWQHHSHLYQTALISSSYNLILKYKKTPNSLMRNQREEHWEKSYGPMRTIPKTWKQILVRFFLKLLKKHFHGNHKLYQIFKKYIVKISCSSSRNMVSLILAHNQQLLCPVKENYGCYCRVKIDCPMQNKCLTPQVV